jgi:hypothetical protein
MLLASKVQGSVEHSAEPGFSGCEQYPQFKSFIGRVVVYDELKVVAPARGNYNKIKE